jgi:1-acyl-sn-glycerol-3-phosphate acyltransferase
MKVPMVPLFIDVPKAMNTGRTLAPLPGVVDVYINPPISTTEWKLEDLHSHKESLRDLYTAFPAGWTSRS